MSYSGRGLSLSSSCHTAAEIFHLVRHAIQLESYITWLAMPYCYRDILPDSPCHTSADILPVSLCHTATKLFHLAHPAIQLPSYFTWLALPYSYRAISLGSPCHTAAVSFHSYTPSAYGRSQNPGTLVFKFSCQPVLTVPQLLQ